MEDISIRETATDIGSQHVTENHTIIIESKESEGIISQPEERIPGPVERNEPTIASVKDELIERVRRRLAEIETEKQLNIPEVRPEVIHTAGDKMESLRMDFLSKEEIIEKFIREEPRISPPRASFFSSSEYAVKSNRDDTGIVSETLARLYLEQGNILKARMVYEKLSLLFPEKSSYFAALIEKTGNK
jgi:hypothetical protein